MQTEQISMFKQLNNMDYTYKSPNLIMSSYDLSITEQRIITLGCKKIKPVYIEKKITPKDLDTVLSAMHFSNIEISASEYKKEYNLKGNNIYDSLEKYTNSLYNKSIDYFDEKNKLKRKRWVSTATFDRKNGKILLTFNVDMIPDLLVLKNRFVALLFDMSQSLKNKYAFRNYEILKNHLFVGKFKVSLEEYRFMLKITDKYSDFSNLNKKVIKPSLKIINECSDINVTYSFIRSGKSIKWINFIITSKSTTIVKEDSRFKERIPTAFNEISTILKDKYNIDLTSEDAEILFNSAIETTQQKYKNKDAVTFVLDKIKVLDNYIINKKVDNVIGFLNTAIQKDWKISELKQNSNKSFNNFDGRRYTKEEYENIENKLLGWD